MKKLFFIITFLIVITTNIQAQRVFANPAYYDSVTTLNYNSTFQVRYQNETKIITWWRLQSLLGSSSTLLASDNTWSGLNSFTDQLTIPSTLDESLTNGIGFSSGLFSWSTGDSLLIGADRAWVLQTISDSGIAGDLSAYMTKSGNETVSGIKTYTNVNNYINGTVYFPVKNSYSALAGNQQGFINSTNGKVMFQTKDGSNNKYDLTMASEAWVTANFSAVTGFVKATGTQTGVSSTVTASSGTWTLFTLDAQRLLLREDPATKVSRMLYYDLDQGESGLHVHGDLYIPDDAEVQNMIDDQFSYNQPPELTVAADTLTFRDNNYIAAIYKDNDGTDLYISNSYYGAVSFSVEGTQGGFNIYAKNGISASTWGTIKWANESVPTFSDSSKDYEVLLKRKNSTTIYGYWNYLK